jgi:hypothetical protein
VNRVNVLITADNKSFKTAIEESKQEASGLGKHLGDISKIAGGFVVGEGLMKLLNCCAMLPLEVRVSLRRF